MRLIDADSIQEELTVMILYLAGTPKGECIEYAHDLIDAQPTIDIEPVKQAHVVWTESNTSHKTQCCSNCHRTFISRPDETIEFCPHCGAKMDDQEGESWPDLPSDSSACQSVGAIRAKLDRIISEYHSESETQLGYWEPIHPVVYKESKYYKCSECGAVVSHKTAYCPHCGAKMRLIDEEKENTND